MQKAPVPQQLLYLLTQRNRTGTDVHGLSVELNSPWLLTQD